MLWPMMDMSFVTGKFCSVACMRVCVCACVCVCVCVCVRVGTTGEKKDKAAGQRSRSKRLALQRESGKSVGRLKKKNEAGRHGRRSTAARTFCTSSGSSLVT